MSPREKSIKAAAIGFGLFLVIVIMATVLSLVASLINIFVPSKGGKTSIEEINYKISAIDVDLKSTSLEILRGEKFEIKKENLPEDIAIEMNNGVLRIEEELFRFWNSSRDGVITIYVPQDIVLDDLDIKIGAGKVLVSNIGAERFDLEQGAGKVEIKSSTFNDTSIEGGAGKISIEESTLNNLEMSSGVGSTVIEGHILGNNSIHCGVGSVKLKLFDEREDYRIEVDKGIGSIKIDKEDAPSVSGNGTNTLKIDGGVGSVSIDFKN